MRKPTEASEARALTKWASLHPICKKALIAIPNGGSRPMLEAYHMRLQGVKAGVSDYFLAFPVNAYHGLWIELKRPKPYSSVVSKLQQEWINLMNDYGYCAGIAYGWQDAVKAIESYLNG